MKPIAIPDQNYLRECFIYDEESGILYWRRRPVEHFNGDRRGDEWAANRFASAYEGLPALHCRNCKGYRRGKLDGKQLLAHRVIWKLVYGDEPELIDHINRNKSDNRIVNLRPATRSQNARNSKEYSNNTTGTKGVWRAQRGYYAGITIDKKQISKYFRRLADAVSWRKEMEKKASKMEAM